MKRKILLLILTLSIFAESFAFNVNAAQTTAQVGASVGGSLIMSVDAFTVGYGFVMQPAEVAYSAGDTLFDVIEKFIGKEKLNYNQDLGKEVIAVAADSAWISIDPAIKKVLDDENIFYTDRAAEADWLSQHDFVSSSGWFVTVNNVAVKTPLDEQAPVANSVVRVQFSVYGDGADLNQPAGAFSGQTGTTAVKPVFDVVNRDEMYKSMMAYTKDGILEIGEAILEIVTDPAVKQTDINKALDDLKSWLVEIDPNEFDEVEDETTETGEDTDTDNSNVDDGEDDELNPDDDNTTTTATTVTDDDDESTATDVDNDNDNNNNNAETDSDSDNSDNRPEETDPPVTRPVETTATTASELPYIPDDGKGSGNLPKDDGATTGVTVPLAIAAGTGVAAAITARRRKKRFKK